MTAAVTLAVRHPLDPLAAEEIAQAAGILRASGHLGPEAFFVRIELHEPAREAARAFRPGDAVDRQAFIVVRDRRARATFEAVVSLARGEVVEWRERGGLVPPIVLEEVLACEAAIKAHPGWQEALRKRGVTDTSLAMVDPWSAGFYGPEDAPERRRILRALTWVRRDPADNAYARPIEGLITEFDLDRMEVVGIEDHGVVPLPPKAGNYGPAGIADPDNSPHFAGLRADLRPLAITQPEGVSFELSGHALAWQKWRMRIGFNAREGLVLHTIGYEDRGRVRPILHRASVSEMWVPYGDPAPTHRRKQVFDMGEYGVGALTNSLALGCDCLGEIRYLDAVVSDAAGGPVTIENAICVHEEDFGILWKHLDPRSGYTEVRRSRRLVVSSIATVGNYEYGFYWYFYQDGGMELSIKLSGIMSTGAVAPGERPKHGVLVAPGLYGPHHQHYFSVRLDATVDGPRNSVYELNSEPAPSGPDNPYGNAWVVTRTLLGTEGEAQRIVDPLRARSWTIANPSTANAVGDPVAYRLVPGENVLPLAQPDSPALRRAGFATKHLWVTRYDAAERYAAGDYPNQHPGGAGLPEYAARNRAVADTDIVVWYTMGHHHVVRPEDWPVMPVACIGFALNPSGFFDGNPALDVPPAASAGHCHA
jgi:primary-amine oxidase